MFDEIFKRWIDTNSLSQDDIVPILIEWDQTFGEGKLSGNEIVGMLNQDPRIQFLNMGDVLNKALTYIGIKKGYNWITVYSPEGVLIKRFWNNVKT